MNLETANKICIDFAVKHNIKFEQKGECGFGRKCVGFSDNGNYIDYNPYSYDGKLQPLEELYNEDLFKVTPVNAYHKHTCMSVLVLEGLYDEALIQLAKWVIGLEALGEVQIVEYDTKAKGLQAFISGSVGKVIKITKDNSDEG